MEIGVPELLIVLAIVVVLFGVGRVSKLGGEMGNAIREFRQGLRGEDDDSKEAEPEKKSQEIQQDGNV